MTSRATFGDFARAARSQLAVGSPQPIAESLPTRIWQLQEFTRGMDRVVTVMARYSSDIGAVFSGPADRERQRVPGTWPHTSIKVQEAIQNAAGFLLPSRHGVDRPGHLRAVGPAARLDAAATSLAAGRDLLHTHFTTAPDGTRRDRSEWAPAISSAPVTRALLLELGLWARRIAAQGARQALLGPARRGTEEERRRLNAACQWLWVLDSAVQAAQRHDPVSDADVWLLHAIPVNALAPRRVPGGTETVTELSQGTTGCAERVRHAARSAAPDASWSPALTADSLSQAAACGTVISHHCEILLRSLAARAGQQGSADTSAELQAAADAAAEARASWLRAARAWYRITTDTRGTISSGAAETADLALWTGRLAYADAGWTLALGPSQAARTPEALAPEPGDLPGVVAAVHQVCETLTGIAAADYSQIRTAAHAGRLLVPTRSLPDTFDIPQPFAPAPRDRVHLLLAAYDDAGTASAQATAAVATVAADVRAPSHILTVARAAIHADADSAGKDRRQPAEPATETREFPGPVERILHDLGVTSPDVLLRASAIDQAGEQLILDAMQAFEPRYAGSETIGLSRSVATAELINHVLASGSPSAAAILRSPPPRTAQPGAPGPDRSTTRRTHVGHHGTWPTPEAEAEP